MLQDATQLTLGAALRQIAAHQPDSPALLSDLRSLTWGELDVEVDRPTDELEAERCWLRGVRPVPRGALAGDRSRAATVPSRRRNAGEIHRRCPVRSSGPAARRPPRSVGPPYTAQCAPNLPSPVGRGTRGEGQARVTDN